MIEEEASSSDTERAERLPSGSQQRFLRSHHPHSCTDSAARRAPASSTTPSNGIKLEKGKMEMVFINCHLHVCFVTAEPTRAERARDGARYHADTDGAVLAAFPADLAAAVSLGGT